ncbi:MAG: FAD-dependent oxidoreductase [Deinococcales bacterium]|nr:FAD-dependent oxidoreductase [Deinococcales bacterium]
MARFDLLVVGGGLAGCEAAWAAARGGLRTLLVSTSLDTLYNLASDAHRLEPPAGSLMAELAPGLADADGRVDAWALHREVKYALEREPGLHLLQSSVAGLLVEDGRAVGVTTWEGVDRRAAAVALCVGSFLRARLTIGSSVEAAGRLSEMAYDDLHDDLAARGFAFEELTLEAPPVEGSLPYRVACRVLAAGERGPGFALPRVEELYAAGLCVAGYLSYEGAARHGLGLGRALVELAARR